MPEVIQNWLGTTLGVVLDMSPEKFGRNTKDGTLLAQLLYNYGVIPAHILSNVKESKNYYECYNNLVVLKPWLKHIGVGHDDSTLERMASGEGSAAISIFYAVYLNLERKGRLHHISAQKERKMSDDSCQKFKVNWVPEKCISGESGDLVTKVAEPLLKKRDMIQWHKAKCTEIVEQIKKTKARFQKLVQKKPFLGPLVLKHTSSQPIDKRQKEAEETRGNITAFEKKHPQGGHDLNYSELVELQNAYEMQPRLSPNLSEAKNIVTNIKRRKKGEVYARNFQQEMQVMLLDEQWKEIVEKEDKDFESTVCANMLKQSQYEKQMAKKLYMIRNQKKILAENRRKIDSLKVDQCQREYDEIMERNMELRGECWEEEELEKERTAELHRRLYDEKTRHRRAQIKVESRKICEALFDIAIRISEVRELIGCQVPKSFMKDLKELFFKDMPIFNLLEHCEELYDNAQPNFEIIRPCEGEGDVVYYENEEYERLKCEEMDRQSILDECDINDYLRLLGPWMVDLLFPNGSETEVKHLVLGCIVHKLLAVKYPPPNLPICADIKPMKPTSVVQGLVDETATNMLVDLMEVCKILVVRVDDAINFILSAFKEELSAVRDIDLPFQKVTEDALKQRTSNGKEKEPKKKIKLLKKEIVERTLSEEEFLMMDKETQTPRLIPDVDRILSPNAELGKVAFEALGAGDPVPDTIVIPALIAYVVSLQENYDGWVLLNYPILYSQASDLEYFLTGFRTLPLVEEMETLEEVEGFTYRDSWGNPLSGDHFRENRYSRLVPQPDVFSVVDATIPKTYFNSFIKMKRIPETPHRRSQDLQDVSPPMEKFYSDSDILFNFEYQNLSFQTVKNLGRIILGVSFADLESWNLAQKPSVEIFGKAVLDLNEKWEPRRSTKEGGGAKKIGKEPSVSYDNDIEVIGEEREGEREIQDIKSEGREIPIEPPKPGDPTWEWVTGPQPERLLVALATLWENMEAVFIEDLKNVFFCLRVHRHNVIEYSGFVRKSIRTLMRRPDEKQKVLEGFLKMFNEVDEDLRPDVDVKCELHVRVSELEQALMYVADERKANSLKDVTKVAQDGWVPDEMANLVNIFLSVLQLEANRCVDTCQVIMDYYVSLQQKVPDEKQLGKIAVPKLHIQDRKYSVYSATSNKSASVGSPRNSDLKRNNKSLSEQSTKYTQDRTSKTRGINDRKKRSSESGIVGAADFITVILTNLMLPEDGSTPFHSFLIDSVHLVTNEAKAIVENCILEARKIDKPAPSTNRLTKNKKPSDVMGVSANDNLTAEWTTALENEISRFLFRSQLILARGIFDMNEFLTTILNILSSVTEDITEMYLKEIKSISECCKVFKCCIEEEIPVQPFLELKEDEFMVHMDDVPPPSNDKSVKAAVEDDRKRFRFTIDQLNVLFCKLQRIAPDGEIIRRSLVFILEDLRMLKPEVENGNCFPEIWNDMEPDAVATVLNEVYQDLEIVHWKDFIIYALELPLPTELEILTMRHYFRKFDPLVTELITWNDYGTITFWFEKPLSQYTLDCDIEREKIERTKLLLYQMYQVNESQTNYSALLLAFCKDDDPVIGFTKALSLAMGKMVSIGQASPEGSQLDVGETGNFDLGLFSKTDLENIRKPYCCPTSSTEMSVKCIPKEKIVRCECKDNPDSLTDESTEGSYSYDENSVEGEFFYYVSKPQQGFSAVTTVSYNILSSLLKASFPSLPQLSVLLDCDQTFQESVNSIFSNVENSDNCIEVRKLLNHNFIDRLIHSTNKFKFVRLKLVLQSVAKSKVPMSRAVCITNKPNLNYCLRK